MHYRRAGARYIGGFVAIVSRRSWDYAADAGAAEEKAEAAGASGLLRENTLPAK